MIIIPTGNAAQTEIDIQIEVLKGEIASKEKILKEYRGLLSDYKKQIKALEKNLNYLKTKNIKAVSLFEYGQMRSLLEVKSLRSVELHKQIESLERGIVVNNKQVEQLMEERKKKATVILGFKS